MIGLQQSAGGGAAAATHTAEERSGSGGGGPLAAEDAAPPLQQSHAAVSTHATMSDKLGCARLHFSRSRDASRRGRSSSAAATADR